MTKRLRILLLEDSDMDAELVELELARGGLTPQIHRVSSEADFLAALDRGGWDLILSDYSMPQFSAPRALELLRGREIDLPFIIVSGSVGEQVAVAAMKAGAHDFFSKHQLTRLVSAIEREVAEASIRHNLRRTEQNYGLVVESVKDYAIFTLDSQGRISSWNAGAERLIGFVEAEVIGRPWNAFFPTAGSDVAPRSLEVECTRKNGTRFWAECNISAINDGPVLRGYAEIIHDISERKKLIEELKLAVKARDEFLSIASHELKTPLTSFSLQLESARRLTRGGTSISAEKLSPKLELLMRQVERLTGLIDNLLDVGRITSGPVALRREKVELAEVVATVLRRLDETIKRSGSAIHVQAHARPVGNWDPMRIEMIVTNLISNALKYGERKPIAVTIDAKGDHASLTVADQGIGIPTKAQARIFQRFERAVPEEHYGGFGLGLWIVRQIVEAHGGHISVDSEEGKGSTFCVFLPLLNT